MINVSSQLFIVHTKIVGICKMFTENDYICFLNFVENSEKNQVWGYFALHSFERNAITMRSCNVCYEIIKKSL